MNLIDPRASFAQYAADMGLPIDDTIKDDGEIHRFHVKGDKPRSINGWYVLHTGRIAVGTVGSWRTGEQHTWCAKAADEMTSEERAEQRARLKQMRLQRDTERQQRQQQAAGRAARGWHNAGPADRDHPYLIRKGIQPHHLRQQGGLLLVPMVDADGAIQNLQRIAPDGTKKFMYGGRVTGCFALFGELGSGPLYVCEGVATGATIHEQSGLPTACAMNAGNLLAVCTALAAPDRQITVCADNDHRTDGNPGITKGREAAAAAGAAVTWPDTCGPDCTCTDFNDVAHCTSAQEAVA